MNKVLVRWRRSSHIGGARVPRSAKAKTRQTVKVVGYYQRVGTILPSRRTTRLGYHTAQGRPSTVHTRGMGYAARGRQKRLVMVQTLPKNNHQNKQRTSRDETSLGPTKELDVHVSQAHLSISHFCIFQIEGNQREDKVDAITIHNTGGFQPMMPHGWLERRGGTSNATPEGARITIGCSFCTAGGSERTAPARSMDVRCTVPYHGTEGLARRSNNSSEFGVPRGRGVARCVCSRRRTFLHTPTHSPTHTHTHTHARPFPRGQKCVAAKGHNA